MNRQPTEELDIISSADLEKQAALQVAALMAAAARTAPKTRGVDNIRVVAIEDATTRARVVARMREISEKENRPGMGRDAGNIENSPAVIVVAVVSKPAGLNCGFCGKPTCAGLAESGGICAFNTIDLGIAACSAAAVAAQHHADNRLMYSIGRACLDLGMLGEGAVQAIGIPISITGKSPYFDRN